MKLEKDVVYKVYHKNIFYDSKRRSYIIFSPLCDVELVGDSFEKTLSTSFKTHFTVCFDGNIVTKYSKRPSETGVDCSCELMSFKNVDYDEIRKAINLLGNKHQYNRKLNKIVYESNE